jgi:phage tail-like protein
LRRSMAVSFSNLNYFMGHLPARYRVADEGNNNFLRRFMQTFCEELDGFDAKLDAFYQSIAPETASEEYLNWWLFSCFGWAWFPTWFTLARKREFYANIARHYARRGTALGIKEFLEAFGLKVIVDASPQFFGEATAGEDLWSIVEPLGLVIRLFPQGVSAQEDLEFFGEASAGESAAFSPGENLQSVDVDRLIEFVAPLAHIIYIEELQYDQLLSNTGDPARYGAWIAAI